MSTPILTDDVRLEIEALLAEGRKIEAIRVYRESTGADLRLAKEAVEAIELELRGGEDEPPRPIAPSGCAVVLVATGTTLAAAFAAAF